MTWSRADRLRFDKIIKALENSFSVKVWSRDYTPFEILVSTVLSQNTSRDNTIRAFKRLKERFEITAQELASADVEEIKRCIKPAGLYNAKGWRIKKIAQIIWEDYEDDLNKILKLPLNEARRMLLAFPGVGEKTADVILSFAANKGTFPVDRHIDRIARRLKLVKEGADYKEIRGFFEGVLAHNQRRKVHLLLIELGRNICRARNPCCQICPIKEYCKDEDIGQ